MKNTNFKKCPVVVSPASIVDLAELAGGCTRFQWGLIRDTAGMGECWALRAGDDLVGLAGIVPIGPDQGEAWFNFRPGARTHMVSIVRAIRLTIARAPYRAIVTFCVTDAGKRIASAAGFCFARDSDFGEVWAYGRSLRGRSQQAEDGGAAAAEPGRTGSPAVAD